MLRSFKNLISAPAPEVKRADPVDLTLAVCVVLLEIARADDEFSGEERDHVVATLKARYSLSRGQAEELIELAITKRDRSLDLWKFTNRLNETHDREERRRLMEEVWRVIYADGTLDAHEDYFVRKLANLLRLRHSDMIDAKVKVLKELSS